MFTGLQACSSNFCAGVKLGFVMSVILYLIEKASVNNFENGHKGE